MRLVFMPLSIQRLAQSAQLGSSQPAKDRDQDQRAPPACGAGNNRLQLSLGWRDHARVITLGKVKVEIVSRIVGGEAAATRLLKDATQGPNDAPDHFGARAEFVNQHGIAAYLNRGKAA